MRKMMWGIAISLVCAAACGKKSDKPGKADDPAKGSDRATDDKPSDDSIAFALGGKMGMIDAFVLMKKPDQATETLEKAKVLAGALGLDAPHMPGPDEDEDMAIAKELGAKKPDDVKQAFVLGNRLRVAWLGAQLGADPSGPLHDVETAAKKLGIPESEWRTRYDHIKAKPDADEIGQLEDGLQAYLDHATK